MEIRNFCIIAHIDHGKSTLADRMLELTKTVENNKMKNQLLDQMDLERERGITIKLQPVRMKYQENEKEYIYNLIDTPGHVDFSYEVSRTLAAVEGAILLVDASQGIQAQTLANLYQAQKLKLDIIPVLNKIDLPNARIEETKNEVAELLKIDKEQILCVSAKTGQGVEILLKEIALRIRKPEINQESALKALIFDSVYDTYKGVVTYVRIFDGQITKDKVIKFLSNNKTDRTIEVGSFNPRYKIESELCSGEIGYIMTGLKDIKSAKVGDTITLSNAEVKALPGYKKIKPMVYAEFYSKDGDVNKLREALEKLALNDSSLDFEPQSSQVFGFGFKCGFLGLLHLEIIKERLTREYDLDLVITTPKVDYKTEKINQKIQYIEPWVKLEIVTPAQYIGQIMNLTTDIRGRYLDTQYLADRAILYFEAPLANVITNYYDRLKSVSSGYASLNYEFLRYQAEDLVKMDILISGDKIDALSQIVHKNELLARAKNITRKLKDILPKQSFKITIQAAVGGKIIAREDIAALKKDVTAHLYGGDISRKKKLWQKQKEGKKKMQTMGRVDIPTDVFINILK